MEYLFIMGFALLITIPLIILYYTQSSRFAEETASASIERAARQISEAADTVYFLGAPSKRTITVDLPNGIRDTEISGQTVTFTMASSHGQYDQVARTAANLTGTLPKTQGPHVLVLTAQANGIVLIEEK